jgi:NAD-dependent dihydropyrimidine dehydrogenase PreA subunit
MEMKCGAGCTDESAYSCMAVDEEKCNKCGVCVDICPMDVLRFNRKGYPFMQYQNDCWYCDACAFMCPRQAIRMDSLPYLIR